MSLQNKILESGRLILALSFLFFLSTCTKGTSSVERAKDGSNYISKTTVFEKFFAPGAPVNEPIAFYIMTKSGKPVPGVQSEFRSFNITDADSVGISDNGLKEIMLAGWNDESFNVGADGKLGSASCDGGSSRVACAGEVSGGSKLSDEDGRTTVGFRTPNTPSAVLAVAMRVPAGAEASNLIQFVRIKVVSNEDFANSGINPIQAAIVVVPPLFDDQGRRVIKAGSQFNLALHAPGVPNTLFGKGFDFTYETSGLDEPVNGVNVIVPSGTAKCDFQNGQCLIPGGPFKVLRPTTLKFTIKPKDPKFPVMAASIEVPVVTGSVNSMILSLNPPGQAIQNACLNPLDYSQPCLTLSADSDVVDLYPVLIDQAGNFVAAPETLWNVTGPLNGQFAFSNRVPGKQTLLPVVSGSGVLSIAAPQYPGVTLSVTYLVRAGAPAALEARSEHSTASSFTEKATVPFRAKVTLYDRKDNLCVDYNGKIYLSLKLDNTYPSSPPAGITATSVLTSTVNQTVSPITITSGQGVSTAAFNVVKVPNVAASEVRPRIVIDGVVTGTGIAAGLSIKNPVFIDIIPGPPVLTLMRNSSGGLGSSWESLKSAGTPFNVDLLANQQYQFYPAGYDAGGNFAGEVPSNFWGINLNLDPANPVSSGLTAFLPTLNASDPNAFGLQANCPNPNITPVPGVSDATNQPLTNRVYCGLHRGLGIRQGTGTTFGSVGIPGTGRIIAAPLDPTIAYSVTPLLTTTAGVATRFSFELQDASTTVVLTSPVSASRPFKIFIHAQDNNNIDYTGYTGPKDFNVVSTAAESWGGVVPVLPNGTVNCTFVTGVCEFPGIYSVSDSRVPASITIEQITAGGVPGPWSKLISAALGPDAYLYFASKKGGPVASASAMTPAGFSTGIAMTADQEQAFGVSVTDASGNWKRDADNTADQLVFEGFDSAAGSLSSIFTPSTGAWSQVPWTSSYTVSNLFVANGAPIDSLPVTGKKFFDPGVAGDQASILGAGNIDPAKYNIVLVPQNRIGSGYAVIKSLANAALKSWPSPWFKISAGAIEHVDYKLVRIGNPARNNTNVLAGECNDIRIFIHDKKHNQLKDYTTTTNIALKLFKTDGSHPNGLDDPKAGDFSWISAMQAGTQSNDFYFAGNKSEVPGPYNSGFSIAGVDYRAGGRFAGVALSSAQNPLGVMSDWWSGAVSVIAGEIIQPGQLCLMSGQAVTNYNLASPSDTRLLQVDIPSTTINGTTYGAMTSRGANIQYNGASGATVGSTATAHSVSNVFTVFRDGPDHLHATWIDSVMGSQLIGSPGKTYGVGPSGNSPKVSAESATAFVDNNCPFLTPEVDPLTGSVLKFCGSKTVYWHTHDLGHNYIKPGSQAGFILGQSGFDPSTLAVGSPGSLGSPSIVILPSAVNRKIVPSYAGLVVGNTELPITQSAIGGSMGLTYQPGAPQAIVATRIGTPSFETTSPFGFSIKLVDQFGNLTGTGSGPTADPYHQAPYQTSRTLKAFWSATPSNAPSGASPILFGLTTGIHNSLATAFSDAFVNIPQVYLDTDATKQSYLPKSGQTSVLNLSIIDDSTTAWCAVPGNCTATGVQTYNLAVSLTPAAGPAAATVIVSAPSTAGLTFTTANFPTLFNTNPGIGAVYPFKANSMRSLTAYSCSADALGNIGDCLSPSNFSFVNESEAGVLNNQTTMANATSFDFYPNKFGTVQIRATKNGFTGTSDVINVGASPLDRFAVQSIATLTNVTIPAGTEIPFKICMKDGGDNTITSDVVVNAVTVTAANGTLPLNISILNIAPNAENSTMQISTGTGGGFASGLIGSGVQNVTFTSGCSYFYAKVLSAGTYNSVPLLQASYTDTNQSNKLVSGMGLIGIDSVTPLSLDHYATVVSSLRGTPLPNSTAAWAAPGTTNTLAAIGGNRFHVLLSARDTHGNNISVTKTVTLGLLEADGTTPIARSPICGAPANDTACLTVNLVGASTSTISNLAVDIGGRNLYISAADGSANLKGAVSTMIYAESSVKTVKNYVVSAPTSVNAGIPTSISVIAKDSSGATVQGADAGLNTLNFVWLDANSNLLTTNHSAPDATPPTVGASKLNFSAGAAFANLTFTKAESGLAINIRDDQTPSIVSGNLTTTVVSPGSTLKYSFSCAMSTGGADCTGTSGAPYVIDASPQSRFNLTVQAYDQYKNPKASGESPPSIRVNRVSGATTVSSLEQTPLTVTYDSSDQVPVDTNNVSGGTLNNLFYRAGNQVVFYDIDPGTSPYTGIYNTVYHSYQPHIDMVYDYSFVNLPTTPTAGNNYTTIRLCARDKAGNIATGIDAALGAQTFTWSGPANAPNGASPSMPPSALTFTSGVTSNLTVAFLKAESFSFGVTDNYAPAVAGVGGIGSGLKRRSRIIPSYDLIVGHALPSNYLISVASSSPAAGAAFNLSLTARDQYNNIATGWTTDNLTFTWSSGASSSISNPKTAGVLSPGVVGAGAKAFTNGVFATAGTPFVLYRSNLTAVAPPESSILTVTGTNNATQSTTPLTQSLTFTPTPSASSGYVKLTSSSAYSGGTVLSGSALAMTTDQTKNFFAHIFDDFGNYKGNTSNVSWTGSSVLSGKLSPSTGNITTLNPTTAGTGVVTADCSGLTVGCVSDSTGAVTVGVGNITKLVFISPTPTTNYTQNVEDCQQLTIQSQDVNSNAVLAATNIPVTFASTGGNGDFYASAGECSTAQGGGDTAVINTSVFHTSSLAGSVGSRSANILTGDSNLSVWYANRTKVAANGVTITGASGGWSDSRAATITAGPTRRLAFTSASPILDAVGGSVTCATLTYKFQDKWQNDTPSTASSTVNLSSNSAGGVFASDSGCTTPIAGGIRVVASASATDTVYYKDTQASIATISLLATSTLSGNPDLQLQTLTATVNPASFAVTSPISGSKVKDTVTVTWAASPGARDYTVSYGTTTACSTTLLTTSSTSANITAGLNATEYVCVRANGYTGASPGTPQMAATSNASYLLIIDNSGPTGAITAPGAVTYIGPLTTAMGSGSTTTYAGTAADSQAGVQKVEVQLQQGTNYWTGATWSAIPTWLLAAGTASWTYVINDSDMNTAGDAANYTLRVQVTDNAGNVTSAAASKAFTWKSVAPTAILTGKPGTLLVTDYYSNSTNIGVSVGGALVKDYKYAIVSGSTCGSPTYGSFTGFATNITGNPGGDGQYTLCVLARDEAENVQVSPTIHTWYKDVVAPSISGLSAQSVNAAYTPSPSVTDSGAPVGSVISYVWSVETASNSCSVTFGGSGSASQAPTISLSGCATNTYGNFGAPTLKLTATDTAGNSSSSSFVLTWDQETPRVSVITSPLATGHYKAGQVVPVTVKFVKSGSNPNVSTYALIVTGSPILTLNTTPAQNATASAGTVVNSSSSVTLTFNYTVQSGDNSGSQSGVLLNVASATALALSGGTIKDNIGTGNSALLTGLPTSGASSLVNKSVNIDTAAPTLAFSSGLPSAQSKITTMAIAISATDTTTYTYALISGSSAGCSGASYVGSATGVGTNITNNITSSPNLADGTVTICAQATDLAGNVQSGYTSYTWTKDTVAPAVLTISAPTGQISSATPTVTWSAPAGDVNGIELLVSKTSGCGSNIVESYLYSGGTYGQLAGNAVSQAIAATIADGTTYICMYVVDVALNKSTAIAGSFEVETDTVHTSWTDANGVQYGRKPNIGAWSVETVDSGVGTYNSRTSIGVDNSAQAVVSYSVDDASSTFMRYRKRTAVNTWSAAATINSAANATMAGIGSFNDIGIATTSTVYSAFFGYDSSTPGLVGGVNSTVGTGIQISATAATDFKDMSMSIGTSNSQYAVASRLVSSNYLLVIQNTGAGAGGTVTLPTNCTDATYVSTFAKNSDSVIGMATACVMNDGSCKAYYGEATYTGSGPNFTYSAWTLIGTIKASACTLASLTAADRPTLVYDRQNSYKRSVAWRDQDNNQIKRWTDESGSNANETVLTGVGTIGYPMIAYDKVGKSYVSYKDGDAVKFVTNNARTFGAYTGGWSSPVAVVSGTTLIGIGGIGISGMKGRGNTTSGQ